MASKGVVMHFTFSSRLVLFRHHLKAHIPQFEELAAPEPGYANVNHCGCGLDHLIDNLASKWV
jgi:hypothetical protein